MMDYKDGKMGLPWIVSLQAADWARLWVKTLGWLLYQWLAGCGRRGWCLAG